MTRTLLASQELTHVRRWALLGVLLAILAVCGLVMVWVNQVALPPSLAAQLKPGDRHQVDIVLVDQPDLTVPELRALVKPMLMVAALRMSSHPQHLRIVVCREGFPRGYAGGGIGAAGYVPENDSFVVNAQAVRTAPLSTLTPDQRWAFVMAHETAHLWQAQRGDLSHRSSALMAPQVYKTDPVELEAYQEGVSVANALDGPPFRWKVKDGLPLMAASPNPYEAWAKLDVAAIAELRVSTQLDALGRLQAIWDSWTE